MSNILFRLFEGLIIRRRIVPQGYASVFILICLFFCPKKKLDQALLPIQYEVFDPISSFPNPKDSILVIRGGFTSFFCSVRPTCGTPVLLTVTSKNWFSNDFWLWAKTDRTKTNVFCANVLPVGRTDSFFERRRNAVHCDRVRRRGKIRWKNEVEKRNYVFLAQMRDYLFVAKIFGEGGGIKGAIFRDEWILHIDCCLIAYWLRPYTFYVLWWKTLTRRAYNRLINPINRKKNVNLHRELVKPHI